MVVCLINEFLSQCIKGKLLTHHFDMKKRYRGIVIQHSVCHSSSKKPIFLHSFRRSLIWYIFNPPPHQDFPVNNKNQHSLRQFADDLVWYTEGWILLISFYSRAAASLRLVWVLLFQKKKKKTFVFLTSF